MNHGSHMGISKYDFHFSRIGTLSRLAWNMHSCRVMQQFDDNRWLSDRIKSENHNYMTNWSKWTHINQFVPRRLSDASHGKNSGVPMIHFHVGGSSCHGVRGDVAASNLEPQEASIPRSGGFVEDLKLLFDAGLPQRKWAARLSDLVLNNSENDTICLCTVCFAHILLSSWILCISAKATLCTLHHCLCLQFSVLADVQKTSGSDMFFCQDHFQDVSCLMQASHCFNEVRMVRAAPQVSSLTVFAAKQLGSGLFGTSCWSILRKPGSSLLEWFELLFFYQESLHRLVANSK